MIKNVITQDMYIGRTVSFRIRRNQHKNLFKRHKPGFLYENMRTHGSKNFEFSVLEKVDDRNLLDEKEVFWFDKLNPYYNILTAGKSGKVREVHLERKAKIKETRIKMKRWQKPKEPLDEELEERLDRTLEKVFLCMNCGNEYNVKYSPKNSFEDLMKLAFKTHYCGISILKSKYLDALDEKRRLLTDQT